MATRKKSTTTDESRKSANDIWLAGIGAFNFVGEEGGRLFQNLVEKGREFKEEHEGGRVSRFAEQAMGLKEDARSVLSKVTTPIEDGLTATMQRLGMPTRAEIVKLTNRVEELTRMVQQARKAKDASPAAPRAAARPKAKAKPKAKPRTTKAAAAETTA